MFKGNYKKIFLSLLLLLMVFSPLRVVRGAYGSILPADTAKAIQTKYVDNPELSVDCSIITGFGPIPGEFHWDCLIAKISFKFFFIPSAKFLSMSGKMFDYVTKETIIEMKENFYPQDSNTGINVTWKIFRDLANILFIFALLYISILTIIKGIGSTGKIIANILVIALLINFSLFFTKVIIDISNITAISFYNSIQREYDAEGRLDLYGYLRTDQDAPVINRNESYGIAAPFIQKAGITSLFTMNNPTLTKIAYQSIFGSVICIVLAIVLALVSIMLLTRFIVLLFLMIISSAAIGSHILPKLKELVYDRWLSVLIGQSFFVPVFFLFLYVSLVLLNSISFVDVNEKTKEIGGFSGFTEVLKASSGSILTYLMIIGFLVASLKIAKSMTNDKATSKIRDGLTKGLGVVAIGGAGWAGRHSLGWVGKQGTDRIAGNNAFSRGVKRLSTRMSNSSYDLRNSKKLSSAIGYTGIEADLGKGAGVGGYSELRKKKDEKRDKISEIIKAPTIKEREAKLALAKKKKELEDEDADFFKNYGKAKKDKIKAERRAERYEQKIENINRLIQNNQGGDNDYIKSLEKELENVKKSKADTLDNLIDINSDIEAAEAKMGNNYDDLKKAAKKASESSENRTASYANVGFFGKISPARREYARRHREQIVKKS